MTIEYCIGIPARLNFEKGSSFLGAQVSSTDRVLIADLKICIVLLGCFLGMRRALMQKRVYFSSGLPHI